MSFRDLLFLLLILLCCVCVVVFLAQMVPRGLFGPRPAGVPSPGDAFVPSSRAWVWIVLPIGAVLLGVGLRVGWEEMKTGRWEAASGKILEARVESVRETRVDLFRRQLPMRRYLAAVAYAYEWKGKTFPGDRVYRENDSALFRFSAGWAMRGLEKGRPVTVYVNPRNPEESVLRRGLRPKTMLLGAAGLFLCGWSVWKV